MNQLATRVIGNGEPVAFIHGFTQTKDSWLPLIHALQSPLQATLIDAPDHGETTASLSLEDTGHSLATQVPHNTLVGYSMGARMALVAAVQHPHLYPRLILISGTAGIEDDTERQQRRDSDEQLAQRIERIGIDAFIEEWLGNALFAGLTRHAARVDERLTNSASGLASSLRLCGTGQQTPLWNALHTLTMPVLLIAGEKDTKFCALAQRMNELLPQSHLHIHPNVGHTVHLEDTPGIATIIDSWLQRTKS